MNNYGYLVYDSDIEAATGQVNASGAVGKQSASQDIFIHHGLTPKGYRNWASFEQGEFDFEKPIFINNGVNKIAYSTIATAIIDDYFDEPFSVTIIPDEPYSSDGFTMRTYMPYYRIEITVTDNDGTRVETFEKTEQTQDEFFYFPFDGLTRALFRFRRVKAGHFAKIISVGFGGTRLITDENLIEEPQFDHYFSLMSDELPLDTLSFTVFKENFTFVTGNKITNSETGQEFYVDTVELNPDQTVTVNCYDGLAKRDVAFNGMMRTDTAVKSTSVLDVLFGGLSYDFASSTDGFNSLTWAGTVSDDVTFREAIRMWLQGCTLAIKRSGNKFVIISPFNETGETLQFDESDIVSIDYEALERYTRVHFSRHRFTVDKTNGMQEAFRDNVELYNQQLDNIETLSFGEPYNSVLVYYVSAQSGDTETLTRVDPNNFVITQTGAYLIKAKNLTYTQEIVAKGYPYKTSYTSIDYNPQISSQFKDNELMISDCTVALNVSNSAYRRRLEFYAKFDIVITLQSIKNYGAGEKVTIDIDEKTFEGFITHKTDTMTGVYDYEILGYEVINNVA